MVSLMLLACLSLARVTVYPLARRMSSNRKAISPADSRTRPVSLAVGAPYPFMP